jgi:hypothetical protein
VTDERPNEPPNEPSRDEPGLPPPPEFAGFEASPGAEASVPAAEQPLGPPPPSPFAGLPTSAGSVVRLTFDLLTRAGPELRRGSFYVGLIVFGLVAPLALIAWGLEVAFPNAVEYSDIIETQAAVDATQRVDGWVFIASVLAFAGFIVAFVESRAVAMAVLGARLEGRRLELRDAVQRSRQVFWRVIGGLLIVSVPLGIFQVVVGNWLVGVFHGASEITVLTPSIVAAIVGTPFAYVVAGIVLGDVGVIESARRSVRLFRARPRAALVVSLFAFAAQLLSLVGVTAGLDILLRIFEPLHLGPASGDVGIAATTALVVIFVFAFGTLLFTVAALSVAPQVVMFLALTHTTLGLDHIEEGPPGHWAEPPRRRFRWLTIPMLGAIALGGLSTVATLATLAR